MPTSLDYRGWAGQAYGWRFLAQRLDGSGAPGEFLVNELPLQAVGITDMLSGPSQMVAEISPVYAEMKGVDGLPILGEWGTLIHAEADGEIRASCILVGTGENGPTMSLDCSGMSTIMKGMAYPGSISFSNTDPLDIVRHMWSTVQASADSNLGVIVSPFATSPIRIGGAVAPVTSGASSTDPTLTGAATVQPYLLNWWSTFDLGQEIDNLAQSTPFDYHERNQWNAAHTGIDHYLDLGYPALGRRQTNLRFVQGENIQTMPQVSRDGGDFSNHVVVLGAGEGSVRIKGEARVSDGRVRRMVVIDDPSITDPAEAVFAARLELARRQQILQVNDFVIRNTPMAPIGSFGVGDEIRLQADTDWEPVDMWCRIVKLTITPHQPDMISIAVVRSDWLI